MKTKITAVLVVLAIATATAVVAANPFGSVRTIPLPIQGDPIPGVDVSIEQNPSGIIVATTQTDSHGIAKFTNIAPDNYVIRTKSPSRKASNNYNSAKSNTAGIAGATVVSGDLTFSKDKPGKAIVKVSGTTPQTIEVTAKEGPDPTPTPKPNPRN